MINNRGFTLVEMIVTVVIVSILMAVAVPISMNYFQDVSNNKILGEAESVKKMIERSHPAILSALNGTYQENKNYVFDTDNLNNFVIKAHGNGEIVQLILSPTTGDIEQMIYKLDDDFAVYNNEKDKFEIDNDYSLNHSLKKIKN